MNKHLQIINKLPDEVKEIVNSLAATEFNIEI